MANRSVTRSNDFRVTNEEKYKELISGLYSDDQEIKFWAKTGDDGDIRHGFGAFRKIKYAEQMTVKEYILDYDLEKRNEDLTVWYYVWKTWPEKSTKDIVFSHPEWYIDCIDFNGKTVTVYVKTETDDADPVERDMTDFYEKLQKILPENEVFVLTEISHDLLEYVTGTITVVTPDAIKTSSMHDMALQLAGRQMNYPEPPLRSLQLEKIPSNTRDFSHK